MGGGGREREREREREKRESAVSGTNCAGNVLLRSLPLAMLPYHNSPNSYNSYNSKSYDSNCQWY